MLISLYSSKGGAGKTTTVISLLGALAENNKKEPDRSVNILAIDADKQGTLSAFSKGRADAGRSDYNITFVQRNFSDLSSDALAELDEQYDVTVTDLPGFYDDHSLRLTLLSDVIIVPTNLGVAEMKEAFAAMNNLTTLRDEVGGNGRHALLLSRVNAVGRMTPRFSKVLFETMLRGGYNVLNAKVSDQHGYQAQMDYSAYLFEQVEEESAKSSSRALGESRSLLQAILGFDLIKNDPERSSEILENLGKDK